MTEPKAYRIGFLLVPGFPILALSSAMEPLRAANRLAGKALYEWRLIGLDREPVPSGGELDLTPHQTIDDDLDADSLIVVSGINVAGYRDPRLFGWLSALARTPIRLGALSTGTLLLARAGVIGSERVTIHWEYLPEFAREFPRINASRELYCIDGDRLTCAGGVAAMDLMLALIATEHGAALAAGVADQFLYSQPRPCSDFQVSDARRRYGVTNKLVLDVIKLMEDHIEDPITTKYAAALAGASERQIERLFLKTFATTPSRFYRELRLKAAQQLLRQSTDSIPEIAVRCGFSSASHFGKYFRETYNTTPAKFRRQDA